LSAHFRAGKLDDMTSSLRPWIRSRRLCAAAFLAWLLLVWQSLGAMPAPLPDGAMPMPAAAAHALAQAAHAEPCCDPAPGHAVHHRCDCAAMCAGVLPFRAVAEVAGMPLARAYGPPVRAGVPSRALPSPLRPPAA